MGKDYDVLVKDQLFFGGAKDAEVDLHKNPLML